MKKKIKISRCYSIESSIKKITTSANVIATFHFSSYHERSEFD